MTKGNNYGLILAGLASVLVFMGALMAGYPQVRTVAAIIGAFCFWLSDY